MIVEGGGKVNFFKTGLANEGAHFANLSLHSVFSQTLPLVEHAQLVLDMRSQ